MTDMTARFALPLLAPGQAQKEMFHNEALALIDALQHASVVAVGVEAPPSAPIEGDCWLVGPAPTGAWIGHAGALAAWTAGGWRYAVAREGMTVWDTANGRTLRRVGSTWVVGAPATPRPDITDPSGGGTIDEIARSAIVAMLAALRHHGLIAS